MNEQFKGEKCPIPQKPSPRTAAERKRMQLYEEFEAALDEERSIMKKIDNVFATTPDLEKAEKIVVKKYASRLKELWKKTKQTQQDINEWLDTIKKTRRKKRE